MKQVQRIVSQPTVPFLNPCMSKMASSCIRIGSSFPRHSGNRFCTISMLLTRERHGWNSELARLCSGWECQMTFVRPGSLASTATEMHHHKLLHHHFQTHRHRLPLTLFLQISLNMVATNTL